MVIIIDDDGVCLDDDHGEENGQWPLAIGLQQRGGARRTKCACSTLSTLLGSSAVAVAHCTSFFARVFPC